MRQSVLVVDDIVENIEVLEAILQSEYDVKAATKGLAALKIAEKTQPDIILLDIMMPEMDGYEVCQRLKANPRTNHIPIIFVTAMSEEHDEVKGLELGAVDYVTKPISPVIVKARLRTQLALANQQKELDRQVKLKTKELELSRIDLVNRLGRAADFKDSDTGVHVVRMSKYARVIASHIQLSENEIDLIEHATPMHDVGKIGIPDRVLLKPGKLDPDEWEIMKTHAQIGYDILSDSDDVLLHAAAIIALEHHEKWNGKGYPKGLKKDEIHLYARICAIADVFDALTSVRPYKKAWTFEDATDLIKSERGEHFDPQLVDAFFEGIDEVKEIYSTEQA